MAIETVGQAHDTELTRLLIDHLMGETDGMPKVTSHYPDHPSLTSLILVLFEFQNGEQGLNPVKASKKWMNLQMFCMCTELVE